MNIRFDKFNELKRKVTAAHIIVFLMLWMFLMFVGWFELDFTDETSVATESTPNIVKTKLPDKIAPVPVQKKSLPSHHDTVQTKVKTNSDIELPKKIKPGLSERPPIITKGSPVITQKQPITKVKKQPKPKVALATNRLHSKNQLHSDNASSVDIVPAEPVPEPIHEPTPEPIIEPIAEPVAPPPQVRTITPKINAFYSYRDMPPKVGFMWESLQDVDSYDIVISTDSNFSTELTRERVTSASFSHGRLLAGKYYWKVRANIGSVEGSFSQTNIIYVQRDVDPPKLDVEFPPEIISKNTHKITGTTDPNIPNIFINESAVTVSDTGEFTFTLILKPGANVVIVEAIDNAGNINYKAQLVTVMGK